MAGAGDTFGAQLPGRAEHMALRLERTAARAGIAEAGFLRTVHGVAMEPRRRLLPDEDAPQYLHPGRTAIVALTEGGVSDVDALAAALFLESLDPRLAVEAERVRELGDDRVTTAWHRARELPRPDSPGLVETLVTADQATAAVLLAEWVDQLRHVRLWAAPERVAEAHRLTREVYLPAAERGHETLARRLRWWLRRVPGE